MLMVEELNIKDLSLGAMFLYGLKSTNIQRRIFNFSVIIAIVGKLIMGEIALI